MTVRELIEELLTYDMEEDVCFIDNDGNNNDILFADIMYTKENTSFIGLCSGLVVPFDKILSNSEHWSDNLGSEYTEEEVDKAMRITYKQCLVSVLDFLKSERESHK